MRATSDITDGGSEYPADVPQGFAAYCARFLSVVFHPLFVPLYVAGFLLFLHPTLFAGFNGTARFRLLGSVFVNLTLLPAVTVFLCRRLGFVRSLHLRTQKERIIPLAAAMIFYFWCWFILRNFAEVPELFRQFLLGSFITIIAGWLANIYYRISLHALAMGGLAGFSLIATFMTEGGSAMHPALAVIVAGAVCSSRLVLTAHRPFEVYSGFLTGFICQVLAIWFS